MRKLFSSIGLFLLLLLTYLIVVIKFNNYNDIASKLPSNFTPKNKIDTKQIKIDKLLFPSVLIPNLITDDMVLEDIQINLSFFSLLSFNPKIQDFTIGRAYIKINSEENNIKSNYESILRKLTDPSIYHNNIKIIKLHFVNQQNVTVSEMENVQFTKKGKLLQVKSTGKNKFLLDINNEAQSFNLNFEKNTPTSSVGIFNCSGNYSQDLEIEHLDVEAKIKNLPYHLSLLIPEAKNIFSNFSSSEEVIFTAQIQKKNKDTNSISFNFDNPLLKGRGLVVLGHAQEENTVQFIFETIDIRDWKYDTKTRGNPIYNSEAQQQLRQINASIEIKEFILSNSNTLKDFQFTSIIQGDKFLINKCRANFAQGGEMSLLGEIKQNLFRSFFTGKAKLSHKNLNELLPILELEEYASKDPIPFTFNSDVKFSSVDLLFNNLTLQTNHHRVLGNVLMKFIGNTKRTKTNLTMDYLDLDKKDFPVFFKFYEQAKSLLTESSSENYLNKFIPIRTLRSNNSLDLKVDKINIAGENYSNFSLIVSSEPGKILIDNLSLSHSKFGFVECSAQLDAQDVTPKFTLEFKDLKLLKQKKSFVNDEAIAQLKNIPQIIDFNKIQFNISGKASELNLGNFPLKQTSFEFENNRKLIQMKKFDAGIANGKITAAGGFYLDPFSLKFSYSLDKISLPLIKDITEHNFSSFGAGTFVSSGMFSTFGDSLKALIFNLRLDGKFLFKDTILGNISIDEMIKEIRSPSYSYEVLKSDIDKYLLTGKTKLEYLIFDASLVKGKTDIKSLKFKTETSVGSGIASINLYDWSLSASSQFSFYIDSGREAKPVSLGMTSSGNLFSPKHKLDIAPLDEHFSK